jgi:prevent-host-death family protein
MGIQLRKDTWQLQDAKAKFSQLIKSAEKAPQIITVRGEETAVIISIDKYRKLEGRNPTLWEVFQDSPFKDVELELPTFPPEGIREIDF